ncbi:hypothetical protein D9M70_409510 [compost metagenome]
MGSGLGNELGQGRRFAFVLDGIQHCPRPGVVHPGSQQIAFQALDICSGDLGIQFHQQVPGPDPLAVMDMDGLDHRHVAGLDDLALAVGDYPPGCGGHHVYLAQAGPEQRGGGERHDRPLDVARRRMHRLLLQRQRRGQELYFVGKAWRSVHGLATAPGMTPGGAVSAQQRAGSGRPVHAAPPCSRCNRA